jgi:sugar phosphate isomerase/epimerase
MLTNSLRQATSSRSLSGRARYAARELLDNTTRLIPGDGISPLERILRKLSEKEYSGSLSVELFLPQFQQADPYELARRIRERAEPLMCRAGV